MWHYLLAYYRSKYKRVTIPNIYEGPNKRVGPNEYAVTIVFRKNTHFLHKHYVNRVDLS